MDRRLGPGLEEQDREDRLTWVGPCPGPNVSMGSSGQHQPLGQMVLSRVLATVHQMYPFPLSCLAMAPSIMSQWNQRKLAPNYRLLSVKNGSGAAGVCQLVEAGWLTHHGTIYVCMRTHISERPKLPSFWLSCASAGSAHPPMWMPQQKPLAFHL